MNIEDMKVEPCGTTPETYIVMLNGNSVTDNIHPDEASAVSEMLEIQDEYECETFGSNRTSIPKNFDADADDEGWVED